MTSASTCPRTGCACPCDVQECPVPGRLDGDFVLFHDRHRVNFLKYAELRGLSQHDAEDVVSDAFTTLYKRRSVLRAARCKPAFAFKVLKDSLSDFRRRRARRPEPIAECADEPHAPDDVAGLVAMLDFQRQLATLPEKQAECLALYVLLGQDTGDIARYLGISGSAVRSHISHARRRLGGGFGVREVTE